MCYTTPMTKTDTIGVTHHSFTSTVFPTDEDMKLWESLSPSDQRSVLLGKIKEGLDSKPAENSSKAEIMSEVLSEVKNEL